MFGMGGGNTIEVEVQATGADEFARDMDSAADAVGGFADKTKLAGGALAGIGAAGAAAIAKFTSQAMDLETGMAEVSTLMGEGGNAAAEFGGTVADLTRTFAPHGGQVETVSGLYQVLSAGFGETEAEANNVLGAAMQLSTAGLAPLEDTTIALTGTLNAFGYTADDAETVADIFFTTVKEGQTTIPELATQIGRVSPIAAAAGVSLEEVAAATATLTASGQSTEQAMTGTRQAIQSLLKPTPALAGLIQSLGYESGQAMIEQLGFHGSLLAVAQGAEETGVPMTDLFGSVEALGAILPLTGEQADAMTENMHAMENSAGASDVAMAQIAETAQFQLRQALANVEVATTQLGMAFLSMLMPAIQTTGAVLQTATDWFMGLEAGTQKMIAALFAGATAFALIEGAILLGAVPALAAAGAAMLPVLILGAKLAAIAAVLSLAWHTNFLGIQDITTAVMASVQAYLAAFNAYIQNVVVPQVQALYQTFADYWGRIAPDVQRIFDAVSTVLRVAFAVIETVVRAGLELATGLWNTYLEPLVPYVTGIFGAIGTLIALAIGAVADNMETGLARARFAWDNYILPLAQLAQTVFGQVRDAITAALAIVVPIVEGALARISELWTTYVTPLVETTRARFAEIQAAIAGVLTFVRDSVITPFVAWITGLWTTTFGGMAEETTTTWNSIRDRINVAVAFIRDVVLQPFVSWLEGMWNEHGVVMVAAATETWDAIQTKIAAVVAVVRPLVETFVTALSDAFAWLSATVGPVVTALVGLIQAAWVQLDAVVRPIVGALVDAIQAVWVRLDALLRPLVAGMMDFIRTTIDVGVQGIMALWRLFGDDLVASLTTAFTLIKLAVEQVFDTIATLFVVGMALIRGDWELAWETVVGFLTRTFERMVALVTSFYTTFTGWVDSLVQGVVGLFQWLYDRLVGGSIIPEMFAAIMTAALGFGTSLMEWLGGLVERFVLAVSGWMERVRVSVLTGLQSLHTFFTTFGTNVLLWLTGLVTTFVERTRLWFQTVGTTIQTSLQTVYTQFVAWGQQALAWLQQTATLFVQRVTLWMQQWHTTLLTTLNTLAQAFITFGTNVLGWLSQTAVAFGQRVGAWMQAFTQTFTGGVNAVFSAAVQFGANLLNWLAQTAGNFIRTVSAWLQQTFQTFQTGFTSILNAAGAFGSNLLGIIVRTAQNFLNIVNNWLRTTYTAFLQSFNAISSYVSGWGGRFISWAFGTLSAVWDIFRNALKLIVDGLWQSFEAMLKYVMGWAVDFATEIFNMKEKVVEYFTKLKDAAIQRVEQLFSQTLSKATTWKKNFVGKFDAAYQEVKGKFDKLKKDVVGNSIVPEMLNMTLSAVSGWRRQYVGEFAGANSDVTSTFQRAERRTTGTGIPGATAGRGAVFNPFSGGGRATLDTVAGANFAIHSELQRQTDLMSGGSIAMGGKRAGGGGGTRDPRSAILGSLTGRTAVGAWKASQTGPGLRGGKGVIGHVDPEFAMKEGFQGEWGSLQNAAAIQEIRDWNAVANNSVFAREAGIRQGDTAALVSFAQRDPEGFTAAFYRATPQKGGLSDMVYDALPGFARGGLVTNELLGRIGEAGPEAVIPLDRLERMISRRDEALAERRSGGGTRVYIDSVEVNASSRREGRRAASAFTSELKSRLHSTKPNGTR